MTIDRLGIVGFAIRHFEESKKRNTRWNGQQIRNAFQTATHSRNTRPLQHRKLLRRSKLATLKAWQKPRFNSICTLQRRLAPTLLSERYWSELGPITSSGRFVIGMLSPRPGPHMAPTKTLRLTPTKISCSLCFHRSTPSTIITTHHRRVSRRENVIPCIGRRNGLSIPRVLPKRTPITTTGTTHHITSRVLSIVGGSRSMRKAGTT